MVNRKILIYENLEKETTFIGFSKSIADMVTDPLLFKLFEERGYSAERVLETPKVLLFSQIQVSPIISAEHLEEFGHLCCRGGLIDGKKVRALIDPYENDTYT